MALQPLIQQLSRMLGRDAVEEALASDPGSVATPTTAQADALEALVAANRPAFVAALVAEAADNDDVASAESALAYARLRLNDFAPLLSDRLRAEIELAFQGQTAGWG
jgi:hypothetical protein